MSRRKVYGQSQTRSCPFCGKIAIAKNEQGVPVCVEHKKQLVQDLKCVCGSWLDIRDGKWGAYALCENCGPMNMRKALDINGGAKMETKALGAQNKSPKETVVRSDELDFL